MGMADVQNPLDGYCTKQNRMGMGSSCFVCKSNFHSICSLASKADKQITQTLKMYK